MTKYHINPKTNRPGVCNPAKTGVCRFGENVEHFENKAEANLVIANKLAQENESTQTISRKVSTSPPAIVPSGPYDQQAVNNELKREGGVVYFKNGLTVPETVGDHPNYSRADIEGLYNFSNNLDAYMKEREANGDRSEAAKNIDKTLKESLPTLPDDARREAEKAMRNHESHWQLISAWGSIGIRADEHADYLNSYPRGTTSTLKAIENGQWETFKGATDVRKTASLNMMVNKINNAAYGIEHADRPKYLKENINNGDMILKESIQNARNKQGLEGEDLENYSAKLRSILDEAKAKSPTF